jgi:FkbM family methyltransferase
MLNTTIQANTVKSGPTTYKLFLHSPSTDVFISSPAWNKGNSPGKPFEGDHHVVYKKVMDLIMTHRQTTDALVLDVGANIGTHAMWFASQNYEVHAFEPSQENMKLLRCSAQWNNFRDDKLFLNNVALAEVPHKGDVCMTNNPRNQGGISVSHDCKDNQRIYAELLDDYWTTVLKKRRADFMKIDVEGFEAKAFQGAAEMFRQAPPYVVHTEYSFEFLQRVGSDPEEHLRLIKSFGYSIYIFKHELVPAVLDERSGLRDLLLWHKDLPLPPNNKL